MTSLRRAFAIMKKELRQLSRDRLTFGMIVGIPFLQICLFGYAINTDVRHLRAGVADLAQTSLSRQLVATIQASQVADFVVDTPRIEDLLADMRAGNIKLGVVVPEDFERRRSDPTRAAAQLLIDGSDPTILNVARQLAGLRLDARDGLISPDGASRSVAPVLELRNYYNPERRSAVQIVPALIGVILTLTMILFTAVAVVRERERGNFELLITTPVRNIELMAGKITPYILIGLVQVSLVLVVGMLLFNVPVVGRISDLYLASLLFIAATLGLGLTISTIARSQFQAIQLTIFIFLPSMLLSGFMFPFDGMPVVAQWIGRLLPLTHFVEMIRGIMLRGAGLPDLLPHIYALGAFFLVAMTAAVLRFSKRLD